MSYLLVPGALMVVLVVYLAYLFITKRDKKQIRGVATVGFLFVVVWSLIFYFLLR